jgi:prepilin signal peptidase PulO-like enzyme (type II secretory pathway)
LCGAWGFVVGVVLIAFYLIEPGLGLASTAGLMGIGVIYVVSLIWFWIARAMNKRKDVDIDLNFQQIPPE